MPWTDALVRFQEIDLEVHKFNKRLTEIEADLRDDSELADAREIAEQATQAATVARHTQEKLEHELNNAQIERQQTEHSLYSGAITNSRELRDLQAKSQSLQRHISKLEDDVLEAMIAREETDDIAAASAANLTAIAQRRETHISELQAERDKLREIGQALITEANELKPHIPSQIMDSYNYLKPRTAGIPVSRLKGKVCSMCGVEVLQATLRKAKNREEAFCDGCNRLIVL